jgi:phosphoglycerate kinase
MKTIQDINFKDKKALIRVDFNVPLNKELVVTDSTRIEAAKPTIEKILNDGGSCVLLSHLGRPKNKELAFSLQHIVEAVSKVLGVQVLFASDCVGEIAETAVANLKPKQVLLLENVRYHMQETAGDRDFAKKLSKLGDIYVNDAFGSAHRAHASTAIITENFPKNKCFGALLASEIHNLERVLGDSQKPGS